MSRFLWGGASPCSRASARLAAFYETPYGKHPKLQILTIEELFGGKPPNILLVDTSGFKKAARESSGETNLDPPVLTRSLTRVFPIRPD